MHKTFLYAAYGFLLLVGFLHFYIDVIQQHLRGQRAPSAETTYYYGLHAAYSLGQIVFAVMALLIVRSGSDLMSQRSGQALSFIAIAGWFAICLAFVEYIPPRINMAIVFALLVGAAATA